MDTDVLLSFKEAVGKLKNGGVGVIPTDTIYGIVAPALDSRAVERLYQVRGRRPEKPCIILIAEVSDVEKFGVSIDDSVREKLNNYWPGPVSIVLDCDQEKFAYLHRGMKTLAFRLPQNDEFRKFLRQTGPIIAPSANPEGQKPAGTVDEARRYFGDQVDFYVDGGVLVGMASTVLRIKNGEVEIIREGQMKK